MTPPLRNDFRQSRLVMFRFDFREARDFARYILSKRLHRVKSPNAQAKLIHRAFNAALIVSYMRPFHKSNEPEGHARAALQVDSAGVLDATEKTLHHIVKRERDQVFAHSDAQMREIPGYDYEGPNVKLYLYIDPLTEQQTEMLLRMINKWLDHVELLRIQADSQTD